MDDVLTVQDVAKQLKVHPDTARQLLREGKVVHVHVGSRLRVARQELDRFLSGERVDYKCPICRPLAAPA